MPRFLVRLSAIMFALLVLGGALPAEAATVTFSVKPLTAGGTIVPNPLSWSVTFAPTTGGSSVSCTLDQTGQCPVALTTSTTYTETLANGATSVQLGSVQVDPNGNIFGTTPGSGGGGGSCCTTSGNLAFTGTGNLITGDFSNATDSLRVMFQTTTANSLTSVGIIPNGTPGVARANLRVYNASDPNNAARLEMNAATDAVGLDSKANGSGVLLPLVVRMNGTTVMNVSTAGVPTLVISGQTNSFQAATDTVVYRATTDTLTNKTLTSATLTNPVISAIINTGTLTVPTTTDTIVGRATTDTLTNKSIARTELTGTPFTRTYITTTGTTTYTTPAGASALLVGCLGGGGGGGSTTSAGATSGAGGGGGGGAYSEVRVTAPAATYSVFVGGAAAGGLSGAANTGGAGADNTFNTASALCTAKGGSGGIGDTASASSHVLGGVAGGASSSGVGDVKTDGAPGGPGMTSLVAWAIGGVGGNGVGPFGGGGGAQASGAGNPGLGFGGGGAGGSQANNAGSQAGGAGKQGIIVVTEYY